ncbi:hypothetical protein C8Q75DRAFT_457011 [Abortiporus biennis]|nr:hypothetical protein C8Q75DRAFT_457011 [Abortiporus biennis]
MPAFQDFSDYVDKHKTDFIDRLTTAVSIKSVSGNTTPDGRDEVIRMGHWLGDRLKEVGVSVELRDIGEQSVKVDDQDTTIPLPPIVLGKTGNDTSKKTILVYGHYDVQPAPSDDDFNLKVDDAKDTMTGRGSTDDKGPIMGWLNVLEAHHALGLQLPVNMRFCFEGMEESDSTGLDDLIIEEAKKGDQGAFDHVDYVCISDNYWLSTMTPAITYGLRGIAYFEVNIKGPGKDIHSGIYGGTVFEPMTDLFAIMSKLVRSDDAHILIPGVYDGIPEPTEEEREEFRKMKFSIIDDLEIPIGGNVAISSDPVVVLMNRMRNPSLSIHGIFGDVSGVEGATIIPGNVTGRFSIRLVKPQTPDDINKKVTEYLNYEFKKLASKNTLTVTMVTKGDAWVENRDSPNYAAAIAATEEVWGMTPDETREGGSIPIVLTFSEQLKKNILLLPMGRGDDGAHSDVEKMNISNFMIGTKLLGSYLYKIAGV